MLDPTQIASIVDELADAARTRIPMPRLSARYPDMRVADAYAVQRAWQRRGEATGRELYGRKIGLTSKVMQEATGIDEPDYGVIFRDMVLETGAAVPHAGFTNPRVEVELAFVLKSPLHGPRVTLPDVLEATSHVYPALEILSSRIEMADRTIVDTISDNAAMGAMVAGGRPVRVDEVDLRWVAALLYRNQRIEESGVAAAVLDHPAAGVAWLARKLAAHDEGLEAGQHILAGSFTRPLWVYEGDVIHADYGALGAVTCRFS